MATMDTSPAHRPARRAAAPPPCKMGTVGFVGAGRRGVCVHWFCPGLRLDRIRRGAYVRAVMPAGASAAFALIRVPRGQSRPSEEQFRAALQRDRERLHQPPPPGRDRARDRRPVPHHRRRLRARRVRRLGTLTAIAPLTAAAVPACAGTGSSRARAAGRRSRRRCARCPGRSRRAGPSRSGAGRGTSRTPLAAACARRSCLERGEVVLALPAADDLAVALGREHVDAQRDARIGGIGLHVERLELDRIAVDEHRPVELLRDRGLLVAAEVVAPLDRDALLAAAARSPRRR